MDLRPFNVKNHRVKHANLASSSIGSISITAFGTGIGVIPVYWWALTSGVASLAVLNGTSGSTLFQVKTTTGVVVSGEFWDDTFLANKALVLESTLNGAGVTDFHVWYVVRRVSAGGDGVGL